VETLQLFVFGRHSSSTDVILGAVGAGVGGLVVRTFGIVSETSADQTAE
jgi:VanZ family protein